MTDKRNLVRSGGDESPHARRSRLAPVLWAVVVGAVWVAGGNQTAAPGDSAPQTQPASAAASAPVPASSASSPATPLTGGASSAPSPAGPYAVTIDGETFTGQPAGISAGQAVFTIPRGRRTVALRDLWQVHFAEPQDPMSRRGQKLLLLAEGGLLTFEEVSSGQGKILLESQHLGKVAVDMPAASVIYLPAREQTPAALQKRHGELGLPAASTDFLVAEDAKGAYVPVPGVLKAIAAGKVTFEFQKQDRTTDLSLVRIIQLARVAGVPSPPGGYLTAGDGSVLPFAALTFDGTTFSARRDGLTAEAISPAGLAEIRFHSDRLVYLSDLKPAGAVQTGLFDVLFPFRLDRSAAGGPLRLGKTTYAKGLGLHSRCELTYDLQGRFAVLAALAGIDQAGGKRGNAELRILGDGRELLKPTRLAGGDNPVPVRCVVSGVGKLTLIADFGPDGVDVGDYVDLVEARLIRP